MQLVGLPARLVSVQRLFLREPARSVVSLVPWFPSVLVSGQAAEVESRRREVLIPWGEPESVEPLSVQVAWGSQGEFLRAAQFFVGRKRSSVQSGLEAEGEDQPGEPKVVPE